MNQSDQIEVNAYWENTKTVLNLVFACFGGLALFDFISDGAVRNFVSGSSTSSINAEDAIDITLARVTHDYSLNKLRAIEEYKGKTFNVLGFFYSGEDGAGSIRVVLAPPATADIIYGIFPSNYRGQILQLDKGDLVTMRCAGLMEYGLSPAFENCDLISRVDTRGERPAIYFDSKVMDENPYLK